jgi:hypothetical protein
MPRRAPWHLLTHLRLEGISVVSYDAFSLHGQRPEMEGKRRY